MKVVDYIRRKNAILFDITGIQLVPDSQIIDIPAEDVGILSVTNDSSCCPYCKVFLPKSPFLDCEGCPMYEQGNDCYNVDSTYRRILGRLQERTAVKNINDIHRIKKLVKKYNEELVKELK